MTSLKPPPSLATPLYASITISSRVDAQCRAIRRTLFVPHIWISHGGREGQFPYEVLCLFRSLAEEWFVVSRVVVQVPVPESQISVDS